MCNVDCVPLQQAMIPVQLIMNTMSTCNQQGTALCTAHVLSRTSMQSVLLFKLLIGIDIFMQE